LALRDRFLFAQRFCQDDPWAAEAASQRARFVDLATVG
jgi:hypothetical protein